MTQAAKACENSNSTLSVCMATYNGEMYLREFRRRFRQSNVPVILLSASTARGDIARRLQVEATLGKPFFADDLRELVSSLTRDREAVAAS